MRRPGSADAEARPYGRAAHIIRRTCIAVVAGRRTGPAGWKWCHMRGLRMTLRGVMMAATLAGVVFAGGVTAPATGSAGVVSGVRSAGPGAATRSASGADLAAAPAFSGSRPPGLAGLSGVSCVSASFCMAVGDFLSPTVTTSYPPGIIRSLAEEWNGSSWRVLRSAEAVGVLDAVSCTSASFCMAVGGGNLVGPSLAEAWNGRTLRVVKTPSASPHLSAVSCATASFCVGAPSSTASNVAQVWNGRTWQPMNMSGDGCVAFSSLLAEVSCPSAGHCMAVGTYANHAGTAALSKALRWNGNTCRHTNPPGPGQSAGPG